MGGVYVTYVAYGQWHVVTLVWSFKLYYMYRHEEFDFKKIILFWSFKLHLCVQIVCLFVCLFVHWLTIYLMIPFQFNICHRSKHLKIQSGKSIKTLSFHKKNNNSFDICIFSFIYFYLISFLLSSSHFVEVDRTQPQTKGQVGIWKSPVTLLL